MRKIAKENAENYREIFSYPDEYYEISFLKATVLSTLPFEQYVQYVRQCVKNFDNWGICDSFKPKCLRKHRDEYLPYLEEFFSTDKEFSQRHVLVTLLFYYIEEPYYPLIERYLRLADTTYYYVYMAAAWLTAEVLIKDFEKGVDLLTSGILDGKTRNKAIQKARESFRLNKEQKERLKALKIKIR